MEVAILNQAMKRRLDLGSFCVTPVKAEVDNDNTRLFFKRLDGDSEGPICYGHTKHSKEPYTQPDPVGDSA